MNRSAKGAEYDSQGQVPTLSGRRPWTISKKRDVALKGRNNYFGLSGLGPLFVTSNQGRRASRLPLAFIFRAVGALVR
jgi:hypothetical protein